MRDKTRFKKTKAFFKPVFLVFLFIVIWLMQLSGVKTLFLIGGDFNIKVLLLLYIMTLLTSYTLSFLLARELKISSIEKVDIINGFYKKTNLNTTILIVISAVLFQGFFSQIYNFFEFAIPVTKEELEYIKTINENPWYFVLTALIIAPILEEILFRKMILRFLTKSFSIKISLIISSLLFGIFHLNLKQFILATVLGYVIGYIYLLSGTLKYAIIFHFAFNASSFMFIALEYNFFIVLSFALILYMSLRATFKRLEKFKKMRDFRKYYSL